MKGQHEELLVVAMILSSFIIIASFPKPPPIIPPVILWFDDNFFLRQEINYSIEIESNQTDVIIPVVLDTSILIADGKMLSDCADYRIANDQQIALTYNIENGTCNTNDTVVWVIADVNNGNNTLFHYYNNLSAVNSTSTNATFEDTIITWLMDDDPDPQNYASDRYDLTDVSHTQRGIQGSHGEGHSYIGSGDYSTVGNLDNAVPTETGGTFTAYQWVNLGGTRTAGEEKIMGVHEIFIPGVANLSDDLYHFRCTMFNTTTNLFAVNTSSNISDFVGDWHFFGCGLNSTDIYIIEGSSQDNVKVANSSFSGDYKGGTPSFSIKIGTDASNPGLSFNLIGNLDSYFIYNTSKSIDYM